MSSLSALLTDGRYSTRYSSKGALLAEARKVFTHFAGSGSRELTRNAAISGALWSHRTRQTRATCWKHLNYRYFSGPHPPAKAIARLFRKDAPESLRISLLYYHYALRDALVFDLVTERLWERYLARRSAVGIPDVDDFLVERSSSHPEILQWSLSTRKKLCGSILAALRDFGLLSGAVRKRLAKPRLSEDLALYAILYARQAGLSVREVFEGPLPHLFLADHQELRRALASAAGRWQFEFSTSGPVISLRLPWSTVDEFLADFGR